ncbi:hypothetical protein [Catenulispora pinisilvae]|uniref:hypothetical protein n=2 Tax=Catenulispora pinisilvae TaxID=2705253 RepID=UPI001891411B|nr:hypothetical protein [Catenulispora pinisilvae]
MLSIVEEPEGRWTAHRDGTVVGRAELWARPDRRRWLEFRDCAPEVYPALAAAVPGAVYVTVDVADDRTREALLDGGFVVHRAEDDYVVPTDPARTGLAGVRIPPGITFVNAADVDVTNVASQTLLTSLGGRRVGGSVELVRAAPCGGGPGRTVA